MKFYTILNLKIDAFILLAPVRTGSSSAFTTQDEHRRANFCCREDEEVVRDGLLWLRKAGEGLLPYGIVFNPFHCYAVEKHDPVSCTGKGRR